MIDAAQRRARIGLRHRLAGEARAHTVDEAAGAMVALHATDPASVYLAAFARLREPSVAAVERALYDDRSLVRMLGMRRTMWVVARELAPVVQEGATRDVAAKLRRGLEKDLAAGGVARDAAAWLREAEAATVAALRARGDATGAELAAAVPALRAQLTYAEGKSWGGTAAITTRVLTLVAADGLIVRGRPRGSWISGQYRWATAEDWLPGEAAAWSPPDARAELARRWLGAFGPATEADLRWWTGWTGGATRAALAAAGAAEVTLEGGARGFVLAGDDAPVEAPARWVALLPALDPTAMGWAGREWYLGPHSPVLFDRSGNVGPTVWCDGRVAGGWAVRPGGEVAFRLLEDVGREAAAAVERAAGELTALLDGTRVTPRFRTPLERELGG